MSNLVILHYLHRHASFGNDLQDSICGRLMVNAKPLWVRLLPSHGWGGCCFFLDILEISYIPTLLLGLTAKQGCCSKNNFLCTAKTSLCTLGTTLLCTLQYSICGRLMVKAQPFWVKLLPSHLWCVFLEIATLSWVGWGCVCLEILETSYIPTLLLGHIAKQGCCPP